jgi:hypothetical protein
MPRHRENGCVCSEFETLLEPYLDGELAGGPLGTLEAHLEACESCSRDLALARQIRTELRELPRPSCPPAVTRAVLAHAAAHPPVAERLRRLWYGHRLWQPVVVTLLAVALGVGYWRLSAPAPPPGTAYTEEEIAKAEAEVKLALAYLGDIGEIARERFSAEVGVRVVTPFTRSIAGALLPEDEQDGGPKRP